MNGYIDNVVNKAINACKNITNAVKYVDIAFLANVIPANRIIDAT